MALINCHECGREISDKAKACPNCGVPFDVTDLNKSYDAPADLNLTSCPSCKSCNTQTIKMMCENGTSYETSYGGAVTTDLELGMGGMSSESQTVLAEKHTPGSNPEDNATIRVGCFTLLLALGSFALAFSTEARGGQLFFLLLAFAIWGGGAYTLHKVKKGLLDQKKEWNTKVQLYENGWICYKCGNTWLPK